MVLSVSKLSTAAGAERQRRSSFAPLAVDLTLRRSEWVVKVEPLRGGWDVRECWDAARRMETWIAHLNYSVLDVFAEWAFEGNALAVFHDARGLSDEEMQTLARETNLSETTFIFPDEAETEACEGVRVRIFTTQEELPFAGHPTLGTATWLHLNHPTLSGAETIALRLNVGRIGVRFYARGEGEVGVRATMVQKDPVFGATHDRAEVGARDRIECRGSLRRVSSADGVDGGAVLHCVVAIAGSFAAIAVDATRGAGMDSEE